MGQKADELRQRIVAAAATLFYEQGYENTSFTDIAREVGISRGNFYYHFKTKDEILSAVIDFHIRQLTDMMSQWEHDYPDPRERLFHFIDILTTNYDKIKVHGCPIGSLCNELNKLRHALQHDANRMFTVISQWLTEQFKQLNIKNPDAAAMHLLSRSQGIASITQAFSHTQFLSDEVNNLKSWVTDLH